MKSTLTKKIEVDHEFHTYTCDLCGKEMHDAHTSKSVKEPFAVAEDVRIESWTYPERDDFSDGDMHVTGLNCCIDCFNDKIKPLIETTFGVMFNDEVL